VRKLGSRVGGPSEEAGPRTGEQDSLKRRRKKRREGETKQREEPEDKKVSVSTF